MTFCYKCRGCGRTIETQRHLDVPDYCICGGTIIRDYRAEGVGIGEGVRVSRTGTASDQASLFLPTNQDFKGPGDPDGTKGMRQWHETHARKTSAGGRTPKIGDIGRRSF